MHKKLLLLTIGLILVSCSSKEKKAKLLSEWQGMPVTELKEHPYFRTLPKRIVKHKSGNQTWVLKDQSPFQTSAYCQSLGGCMGLPTYSCNNIFSVKDGIIRDFEQEGSCPGGKTIRAPATRE